MKRSTVLKATVIIGIIAAVVLVIAMGGFDAIRDRDRVEEFLTDSGPWGPIAYIFGFVALQPLSLPGALLIVPATFVWSWWEVAIYSMAGGMVASTAGFILARWLARDWIETRVPDKLRPWEQRLADNGLMATIALRLVTGFAPAADWLLGVSRVTVRAFIVGTFIGLVPTTVALAVWGDDAARGISDYPLVAAGIFVVLGLLGRRAYKARQRALGE